MSMQCYAASLFARPSQRSPVKMIAASLSLPGVTISFSAIRTAKDRADDVLPAMREDMLATVPHLRAFAISLCGNRDRADDFVQETLLRALANIKTFRPRTNLHAWLFTILRNLVRSDYRKRRREIEDTDGSYLAGLKSPAEQHSRLELGEFRVALKKLPPSQRRGPASRWRVGLHLRAGGCDLRDLGRDGQEPGQSCTHAARGAARPRQRRQVRSGPHDAGCFGDGRTGLIGPPRFRGRALVRAKSPRTTGIGRDEAAN
jgi:RNA polymerase sigma factor (sigma-70 family)